MPGSTFTSPSTEAGTEPGTTALTVITEEAGTSTILTKGTGAGRCLLFFVFLTRTTGTGTDEDTGESIQSMVISGDKGALGIKAGASTLKLRGIVGALISG